MSELPVGVEYSKGSDISCINCVFMNEEPRIASNFVCSESPGQKLTKYWNYCGHGISRKTGEEFRALIIGDILQQQK